MKNILSLIYILSIAFSYAQITQENRVMDASDFNQGSHSQKGYWVKNNEKPTDVNGSHYLFDSWYNNAKLYTDNTVYSIMNFNFNVFNQRFVAKFSEDSVLIMNTSNINKIVIRDKIFNKYNLDDHTSNPFFEVIGRFDNSILLKKYDIFIKEGSFNPMTQKMIRPSEYIIKEKYFVSDLDGTNVKETKLKKSTILGLFDENKKDKVKEYVDENHLNYKEEDDVQRIFQYTNSL